MEDNRSPATGILISFDDSVTEVKPENEEKEEENEIPSPKEDLFSDLALEMKSRLMMK